MNILASSLDNYSHLKMVICDTGKQIIDFYKSVNDKEKLSEAELLLNVIEWDCVTIAVIGEFKGGKSTLVNALIGKELLPSWTTECSAAIVQLRYGDNPEIIVHFKDGNQKKGTLEDLKNYATVEYADFQSIEYIDVFYPADLLRENLMIVDTPGTNSVVKARELITLNFMNIADAALLVLNAEYLLSANEVRFIKREISPRNYSKIFVVVNRCDVFVDEKEELSENISNAFAHIKKIIPSITNIYPISSLNALDGRVMNDELLIEESSIKNLESDLAEYAVQEGAMERLNRIKQSLVDGLYGYRNELLLREQSAKLDKEKYGIQVNKIETVLDAEVKAVNDLKQTIQTGFMKRRDKLEKEVNAMAESSKQDMMNKYSSLSSDSKIAEKIEADINDDAKMWLKYTDKVWNDFYNDVMKWTAHELSNFDAQLIKESSALMAIHSDSFITSSLTSARVNVQIQSREYTDNIEKSEEISKRQSMISPKTISGLGVGMIAAGFILSGGLGAVIALAGGATLFTGRNNSKSDCDYNMLKRPVTRTEKEYHIGCLDNTYNNIINEIIVNIRDILDKNTNTLIGQVETITHGYFSKIKTQLTTLQNDKACQNTQQILSELGKTKVALDALINTMTTI